VPQPDRHRLRHGPPLAPRRGAVGDDPRRNFGARDHAEPRRDGGDDPGAGQQDLSRAPGRQAPRRYDQDHHTAGTHRHPGSQRPALARETAGGSQITAIARGRQGMTVTRGLALILTVAAAGALVNASSPTAAVATTVRLKAISARVNAKGASLVIEA